MEDVLAAVRGVHYAATISLAGVFAFRCLVATAPSAPRFERRLWLLAWASLGLVLLSGAGWLMVLAARLGGLPLTAVLPQGVVAIVLTQTRFGQVWLGRFAIAVLLGCGLIARRHWQALLPRWAGLALAAALLGSLAWSGHGGATPGRPGELHLAADIIHLLAAGAWLGTLLPLALFLTELRHPAGTVGMAAARRVIHRFSVLAGLSVAILFAAGLVNTWFLAGSIPALIGTLYGRLLLAKITIFAMMVVIGAVNLLRMAPRLAGAADAGRTDGGSPHRAMAASDHLRRNAMIEAALGLVVLGIVGLLGILPPALHTEPGWPLPFRLDLGALAGRAQTVLAILAFCAAACLVAIVATAAAGYYRRMVMAGAGLGLCLGLGWITARPVVEPAYPTSFDTPARPYAAASVAHGARLYAANCALCHGADGRGDGPAAAGLTVRPADLTAPHLFAHSAGDLFWWVGHGRANGVMPGFAAVLSPADRWDVVNFVRARAAGALADRLGSSVSTMATAPIPDFTYETGHTQQTLRSVLRQGPVLLALFSEPPSAARLARLATLSGATAGRLTIIAVDLSGAPVAGETATSVPLAGVSAAVRASLALFAAPSERGATLLLLNRAGDPRARWTGAGPGAAALAADIGELARLPATAPSDAGHGH
ncbi:MAG TPA: copper homeostasis membrane protein CopD [Stellaceae bacterium]|nr:copper homeostasis membrane protein CopD [Stellaceae bacterium]